MLYIVYVLFVVSERIV